MVGAHAEPERTGTTAQTLDGPSNPFSFEVEGGAVTFGARGGTGGVHDKVERDRLFLFRGSSEAIDARVAVNKGKVRAVGRSVPTREP